MIYWRAEEATSSHPLQAGWPILSFFCRTFHFQSPLHHVSAAPSSRGRREKVIVFQAWYYQHLSKRTSRFPEASFHSVNSQKVVLHQNSFQMKGQREIWSWSQIYCCKLVEPLPSSRKPGERKAENHAPPSLKYLLKTGHQWCREKKRVAI